MKVEALLQDLFPLRHSVTTEGGVLAGFGYTDKGEVAVMGTTGHLAVGIEAALKLAGFILKVIRERPGCPVLMLVDTQGQRLSKREELLGINGYLAHLVKCLDLARRKGHRLVTLVYCEAVSGGFLSFGLMADEIHALADAKVRVMNLPAMARITKLPLEMLQELSAESPSFAPGIENFIKLGGVQSVWAPPLAQRLEEALEGRTTKDRRREEGRERLGRKLALPVSRAVADGAMPVG